jgi:4-hydroxybenzoate polyprenyltransferase
MTDIYTDIRADHWIIRILPKPFQPYAKLARLDRPIGTWLLLLPCYWAMVLGTNELPPTGAFLLFALGAIVMRGAGCTLNDILDRGIDAQVERTRNRPLPSGQVTVRQAFIFLLAQLLIGFLVLIQFNHTTIMLGVSSLLLIAIYPLMKRITWWPQLFLGVTFNWGALMGWTAMTGALELAPILLYCAGIFWTLGYDTIYAHQDKEDDKHLGVKSTARLFADKTDKFLKCCYAATIVFLAASGLATGVHWIFYPLLAAPALHLWFQLRRLDINDPASCLTVFRSNRDFGIVVLAVIAAGKFIA